jgi:hypothetical protein
VLFDSADHDDRVDPPHARKLAAAIEAHQAGERSCSASNATPVTVGRTLKQRSSERRSPLLEA